LLLDAWPRNNEPRLTSMNKYFRLHIVLMLALSCPAVALSQNQGGVDILLANARSLEARGRIDLAAQNWRKVLLVNPNQTEALAGLARNARESGQADQERAFLDRLRSVDPHDPDIAAVENLRVFTPDERKRLDQAGQLAMAQKPDQATAIYRQVLGDQQPPLGRWAEPFYEAEAASTGGRAQAISQLRQMCADHPKQEAYRLWLATILTYEPKTRVEGFDLFESIKDPGFIGQARAPWRQALLWDKENPEALAPMEAYLQHYPDKDLQPIVDGLRAKQQQDVLAANREQGFKELRSDQVDAANARFAEALRQSPNDVDAIIGLGYVRLDQKRYSEALSLFDRASTLAPQRQDARAGDDSAKFCLAMQRGAAAEKANQSESAVVAYQDALAVRASDQGALLGLANSLMQQKKYSAAEARFQQVLGEAPNNSEAIAGMGFLRLKEGRFNDAAKLFAQAHKLDPSRADVSKGCRNATFWGIMNQGATALNQGQWKDAVAAYQQAVLFDPTDKDAQEGLANAFLRSGNYNAAAKAYTQLTASWPDDESSWFGLVQAQVKENSPQAAIATTQKIPPQVKQRIEGRSDFYSEMALVYYNAGQQQAGDQALSLALKLARTSDNADALGMRLQIAGTFMDQGKTLRAIEIYRQATQLHPDDSGAWEALVGAYTREGDFSQAVAAVRSMPQSSYETVANHTDFLDSVALLYSSRGECAEAQRVLERSLALEQSGGRQPSLNTQLQLADLLRRRHMYGDAGDMYYEIVARDANSADAWRGYLAVLHLKQADRAVAAEISHIPSAVRAQLEADPSFLILEASAYSSANRNESAIPLLLAARSRYGAQGKPCPINLDIQTAWTMLAVSPDQPELSDILQNAKGRPGLTSDEKAAIEELWATWSTRRAELAFQTKPQLALKILIDAAREYPGNREIQVTLASLYLKRNDKDGALRVFQNWRMAGARAGDYRMAAGAALSARRNDLANQYLRWGLQRFPSDSGLMHMTARQDIAHGDYDDGERELRSALLTLEDPNTSQPHAQALLSPAVTHGTDASTGNHEDSGDFPNPSSSAPTCHPEPTNGIAGDARIRPAALVIPISDPQAQNVQGTSSQASAGEVQTVNQAEKQQMQDEVEAVDDRNTPLMSTGGQASGRLGNAGIDRLIVGDAFLGGTYTAINRVRFGIEGHGVYAYSGTPDGTSTLRFGTLAPNAVFGNQSAVGYSGLAQMSTDTFGVAAGTSPQGFPVHNVIGGFHYRPLDGWFTVQGVRDSVKDSLLSYAGVSDPGTGVRWGGVVANTGTVKFDSAPASGDVYKRFGEYGSASYSFLQGLNVRNNQSLAGNAGLYWQMMPGLALGANASAMHYQRNENFFSFGQGGYFSPQQYYLATIPISWYSRHPSFEYQLRFSGGFQYLQQDSSLYYPVLPGSVTLIQGTYASSKSTAPNYDADIRLGYRLTQYMYLGAFATANNAENYYSQSAGFSLKFMLDPVPTSTDLHINAIPDWTGQQPFSVR
jgi:cellulose synthase operon protein C